MPIGKEVYFWTIIFLNFFSLNEGPFLMKEEFNLYQSFPHSVGRTRQCTADRVCEGRIPKINLGQKFLTRA